VIDLSSPLRKGNKKRAANVYTNEQHLELDFKNSTGQLRAGRNEIHHGNSSHE
jgi:hypothetical protein